MSWNRDLNAVRWTILMVLPIGLIVLLSVSSSRTQPGDAATSGTSTVTMLIDGFSAKDRRSAFGTEWVLARDQLTSADVSGDGRIQFEQKEGRTCLHISARASAEDQAGFTHARLNLDPKSGHFDARGFDGIELRIKGNGQGGAVYLRTPGTRFVRQHYQATFETDGTWQDIRLPFVRFVPVFTNKPLQVATLRTIAIIVDSSKSDADIFVDEISFYRDNKMRRQLTGQEKQVIVHKATEPPFSGKYNDHFDEGTYTCKQCGKTLFESSSKFKSNCGWPSFDSQIEGAVKWQPDADGVRTEIICTNCGGHLGHVFRGEGYTPRNIRYCVNSISMDFVPAEARKMERAVFASGCFWGTEYHFQRAHGVVSTTVGYVGGHVENPTYKQVCTGQTGHAEAVEVTYDPTKTSYEQLVRLFFETHDFTQLDRQGPDVGEQYRSAIFYLNDAQKQIALRLVETLRKRGFDVKTEIAPAEKFWPAEEYHQSYYNKTGKTPYCHAYRPIF